MGLAGAGAKAVGEGAVKLTDLLGDKILQKDESGLTAADYYAKNLYGMSNKTAQKLKDRGQFLDVLDTAQEEGLHTVALGRDYGTKVDELIDDSGKKLGDIRDKAQGLVESDPELRKLAPSPVSVGAKLQEELLNKFPEINTATHTASLKVVNDIVNDFIAGGNEQSFENTREILQNVMKNKGAFERDSPQAKIYAAAYQIATKMEKEGMQNVFNAGELPKEFPEYVKQLQRYQTGKTLAKNLNEFKGQGNISDLKGLIGLPNIGLAELLALGHPIAAGAGFAGKYLVKQFAANKFGLLGSSVAFLRKSADDPQLGGYLAKAGKEALNAHLESLPSVLSGTKLLARSINPVQSLIGDTSGLSHQQQYDKLTASIIQAASDTSVTAQRVGHIAQPFASTSYNLAALVTQKKLGALNYLSSQIPKNPNPPKPFQVNDWKPTKQQQQNFLNTVAVVANPMVVMQHYQDGSLTPADRDTLRAVYPKIYSQMVNKIMISAYDPNGPKLDHAQRMKISMFTGIDIDHALANIGAYQQALQPTGQQPQGKGNSHMKQAKGPTLADMTMTSSQRRTFGLGK
jgi:DNA-binding ferritin-like protein (Dps family)